MSVSDRLKAASPALWESAISHPFINEMGEGSLDPEKFRRYFIQDYVFVNDLVKVSGVAIAKAPDLDSARPIDAFLDNILDAEDAIFLRAFERLGVPESEFRSAEPLPTTAALGSFLVRLSYEGSFAEICCALYVTEGVYLDWANRLRDRGAQPGVPHYQEWIDIHTDESLGPMVRFLDGVLEGTTAQEFPRLQQIFDLTTRYEIAFWHMAYEGESWP
ncbi:MAG: TenA family protein [Dehalococcoidia bacterium]